MWVEVEVDYGKLSEKWKWMNFWKSFHNFGCINHVQPLFRVQLVLLKPKLKWNMLVNCKSESETDIMTCSSIELKVKTHCTKTVGQLNKKWNWKQISWKLFWRLKSKSQNRYRETWWSIEKWKLKQISRKLPPIEIKVWYEQKGGQVDHVHGQSDSIH